MQPHEVEGQRPDPEDEKNHRRRRTTILLLAVISGLVAAITLKLLERV
jgi:hypothetical protein